VAVAVGVDDTHFLHQPLVRQVGPAIHDFGVVHREIRQFFLAIPPRELADLGRADSAVAIVDDYVGVGALVGGWQIDGHLETINDEQEDYLTGISAVG